MSASGRESSIVSMILLVFIVKVIEWEPLPMPKLAVCGASRFQRVSIVWTCMRRLIPVLRYQFRRPPAELDELSEPIRPESRHQAVRAGHLDGLESLCADWPIRSPDDAIGNRFTVGAVV